MSVACDSRWMFNLNRSPPNDWYIISALVRFSKTVCLWDVVGDCWSFGLLGPKI
jgi:hypothetical protein